MHQTHRCGLWPNDNVHPLHHTHTCVFDVSLCLALLFITIILETHWVEGFGKVFGESLKFVVYTKITICHV